MVEVGGTPSSPLPSLLLETGYDRLTLDAVASDVHVGWATLYRKWADKPELVVEAVVSRMPHPDDVDTGVAARRSA